MDTFATIDELEDLIEIVILQPGLYQAVPGQLWAEYRTGGAGSDIYRRYDVLRQIVQALPIEVTAEVVNQYSNRYGEIPQIANEQELREFSLDSGIFQDYAPRTDQVGIFPNVIGVDGSIPGIDPVRSPQFGEQFARASFTPDLQENINVDPTSDPRFGDNNVVNGQGQGRAAGDLNDAARNRFRQFETRDIEVRRQEAEANGLLAEFQEEQRRRALAELAEARDIDLARLAQDQAAAGEQFGLANREASFTNAVNNFSGPLAPTQGNFNSGFQRNRRGIRNTAFGFNTQQRRLTYQNQLRAYARNREDINRQFQDRVDEVNRNAELSQLQTNIPNFEENFFNGVERGDL